MENKTVRLHTEDFWKKFSAVHKMGLFLMGALLILVSGCVKDDLYNTSHPDKGAVVITTDWTAALSESNLPETYFLRMDGGEAKEVKGTTVCYPDLLMPGTHTLSAYNEAERITISGTTATVKLRTDGTLESLPGYLFSTVKELDVVQDDTLRITLPMERRICPITLKLSLEGGNTGKIASINATLGGIAGTVDLLTGIIGTENLAVALDVKQAETKPRAYTEGALEMNCRLVGINPQERQLLTITVTMADGYVQTITSDLSEYLKELNADMKPIELDGKVEVPQDGHFNGTITDWEAGNSDGEDVEIH